MKKAGAIKPIEYFPSHFDFPGTVEFCVRGKSNSALQTCWADDHIAELCHLLHTDIDPFVWAKGATGEGPQARRMLDKLTAKIDSTKDIEAARVLYAIATEAAFEVLRMHLRNPGLFGQIAPKRRLLPSLFSIHPKTRDVTERMYEGSKLGSQTDDANQMYSKAWYVSDAPANVYARAIITNIEMNRNLEPISCQQNGWRGYERKYRVVMKVLPFPKYVAGLDSFPERITPGNVLQFWRKGKEMIEEEMPMFHLRAEWTDYYRRRYKGGAKDGAVRHAIFKDILAALKTIAGVNKKSRDK